MPDMVQLPDVVIGALEQQVLDVLWSEAPLPPSEVHARVAEPGGISVNTVSSALKRLHGKGLLRREKVSHAYVYAPQITRAELQRRLIASVVDRFGTHEGGLLSAFVDLAASDGEAALRRLEALIAERLRGQR